MLEALSIAGGLGFLIGLRYRVLAVAVVSAAVAAVGAVVAYDAGAPLWIILLGPLAAVVALQAGYVAGVVSGHAFVTRYARLRDGRTEHRAPKGLATGAKG
jgi:hypothetical protein